MNLQTKVNDRLTVATQLFSAIEENTYQTKVDWAFASLKLSDDTKLRAGKIKYPVGLVNEYVDVGVAYPWIEAPLVIYSESSDGPPTPRSA